MNAKENMIKQQLMGRNIHDENVLRAMRDVSREDFVPEHLKSMAYDDSPLPIGKGQTISQPYIVAYMAQELGLTPHDKVLEVGSGCGYNSAVLSKLVPHVYTIEIIDWLADLAKENIQKAGITNISVKQGDGYQGWPEEAPFDKVVMTAAAPDIPEPLKAQLRTGGHILAPVGSKIQQLLLLEKIGENEFLQRELIHVRFVPLTGESQRK